MHNVWPEPAAAAGTMRVPVRRLAGLWPWLLMAALQVALGHTGLELAAAVESERSAPRATITVKLLKQESTGRPITLEGLFVRGSEGKAQGKLMQVRAGWCFSLLRFIIVGVIGFIFAHFCTFSLII